jgi:hypothetical protein
VGVDVPTTIEVNRGEGNNETFPIGTGDGVLLLTPVCHTYAIAATYTPQIEGKGMIYLDYGNEAITAFSGQNYGTLTYLNLAENNLNRTEVITELFTALPALRELNVADNAFTVTEYNDFLLHFNGLNLGFTGIIDTTAVQYGGCSETFSGEAVAAHEALIAAGRELRDGGKAVCPVAPIPVANGGGGGGHLEKDVCPEGDNTSSYYDGECGKESEHNVANEDKTSNEEGGSLESMYYAAYRWANGNGITTADTYEAVRISDVITRAEMAKMISMLATKLWYKVPDVEKRECVQFADMKQVNEELQSYVIESCQLGLMGMHGDGIGVLETFSPTKTVTRAEVGTILSRLLRGREYATQPGDETYYARHLQALKDAGIMKTVTYPEMLELRGNILLMLWRSLGK